MNSLAFVAACLTLTNTFTATNTYLSTNAVKDRNVRFTNYFADLSQFPGLTIRNSGGVSVTNTPDTNEIYAVVTPDGRGTQFKARPADKGPTLSYVQQSLINHIQTNTIALTNGLDPASAMSLFSTRTVSTTNFVRNTGFWLKNVHGITGLVCWGNNGSQDIGQGGGVLVSPRHFLCAAHSPVSSPSVVLFVAADNTKVFRKCIDGGQVGTTDVWVTLLDADVPASIEFLPIMPFGWTNQAPGLMNQNPNNKNICIIGNQQQQLYARDLTAVYVNNFVSFTTLSLLGSSWGLSINGGDSGHVVGVVVNNQLVALSHLYTAGSGPDWSQLKSSINAKMSSLSATNGAPSYSLTEYNLNSFPSY